MTDRTMTREDYDASTCPECSNFNIEGGSVSIEGNEARQECWCGDCGASWIDFYQIHRRHIAIGGGHIAIKIE